ncbi:MAG: hypothetical protein IJN84_07965, partial [Clostridia bacterium]|nr:hypothetical protein [Clostridia bacterium]
LDNCKSYHIGNHFTIAVPCITLNLYSVVHIVYSIFCKVEISAVNSAAVFIISFRFIALVYSPCVVDFFAIYTEVKLNRMSFVYCKILRLFCNCRR